MGYFMFIVVLLILILLKVYLVREAKAFMKCYQVLTNMCLNGEIEADEYAERKKALLAQVRPLVKKYLRYKEILR